MSVRYKCKKYISEKAVDNDYLPVSRERKTPFRRLGQGRAEGREFGVRVRSAGLRAKEREMGQGRETA